MTGESTLRNAGVSQKPDSHTGAEARETGEGGKKEKGLAVWGAGWGRERRRTMGEGVGGKGGTDSQIATSLP